MGVPILVADDRGTIVYANSSAEETLQDSYKNISKKSAQELFGEIDNFSKCFRESFGGKRIIIFDIAIKSRSGDKIPIDYMELAQLMAPGGRERFSLISFRKKEESIAEKFIGDEKVESSNYEIIWRGISHEVKNPLGGIKGAAQMLLKNLEKTSPFRNHAHVILRETDRIARFLDGLLSPWQIESKHDADLLELLTEAIELVKSHISETKKHIKINIIADTSLPRIHCDTDALFRAFTNLLKNSVEAIDVQGTIRVTLKLHEDLVYEAKGESKSYLIEVEFFDTGKEIKEEDVPFLFLPFYTNKPGGAGMGLFFVKNTVTSQGGSIRVKLSEEGKAFKVYLPLKKEEA
ncbi:MAG: PAS domain-containing protein [Deltaproteobacteria bacterium]|nr:PAS domain-containing protein [Deltaproteobacteria bacterium]